MHYQIDGCKKKSYLSVDWKKMQDVKKKLIPQCLLLQPIKKNAERISKVNNQGKERESILKVLALSKIYQY